MPDINLLPKELRDDESKSSRKKQPKQDYDLVYPQQNQAHDMVEHPLARKPKKSKNKSWFARWRSRRQESRQSSQYERKQKKKRAQENQEKTSLSNTAHRQEPVQGGRVSEKKNITDRIHPEQLLLPRPSLIDRLMIVLFDWVRPLVNAMRTLSQKIVATLTPPPRGDQSAIDAKKVKNNIDFNKVQKQQEQEKGDLSANQQAVDVGGVTIDKEEDQKKGKEASVNSDASGHIGEKEVQQEHSSHEYDVNLIPKDILERQAMAAPQRLLAGIMGVIVSCVILIVVYVAFLFVGMIQRNTISDLQSQIATTTEQIDELSNRSATALAFQKKLTDVRGLFSNHVYWTDFFDALEAVTLPDVYYVNFAMTGSDRLTISAVGTDYTTVAEQLVAFQEADDFVASAEIYSASAQYDSDGLFQRVNFSVTLEFVDGVFNRELR